MTDSNGKEEAFSLDKYLESFSEALEERVNKVKAREEELARREKLFEETYPESGSNYDVLQLNVGGRTGMAVLRRTLTQFEHSQLAVKFSGRWDDQLEQDGDGNYFVDQEPDDFCKLLSFLRERSNSASSTDPSKYPNPPTPSRSFLRMLEHYGLVPFLYPIEIDALKGGSGVIQEKEPGKFEVRTEALVTFHLRVPDGGPNLVSMEATIGPNVAQLQFGSTYSLSNTKGTGASSGLNDGSGYCSPYAFTPQQLVEGSRIRCKFPFRPHPRIEVQVNDVVVYSKDLDSGKTWSPCLALHGSVEIVLLDMDCA